VELNDIILILGVFLPILLVGVWQLNRLNPSRKDTKQAKAQADSSISELIGVQNTQTKVILDQKNNVIRSLEKKLANIQGEEEQPEEEVADLVKNPEIQKLLQSKGINPSLLDNPVIQKYIKKYTKGMSIEQVLEIANQLGFLKGNKQTQSEASVNEQDGINPNWA